MLLLLYRITLADLLLDEHLHYFHCNLQFWRLSTLIKKIYFGFKSTLQGSLSKIYVPTHVNVCALPLAQNSTWSFLKKGKIAVYANKYSSLKKTSVITKLGVEKNKILGITRATVQTHSSNQAKAYVKPLSIFITFRLIYSTSRSLCFICQ